MSPSSSTTISRSSRPSAAVLAVALTGGIACGKTTVAELLAQKGCFLFSADRAAHELMAPRRAAWRRIKARFGPGVLAPDGSMDRRRLGSIVFEDPAARRFLNRLIHPLVLKEQARLLKKLEKDRPGAIFICEAALVFEAGLEKAYDRVIAVRCRRELQVARIRERQGLSRREALARIRSQLPQAEKARRADYVIDTSGTMAETVEQVERLYAGLMQDASLKALRMKLDGVKKGR